MMEVHSDGCSSVPYTSQYSLGCFDGIDLIATRVEHT